MLKERLQKGMEVEMEGKQKEDEGRRKRNGYKSNEKI